MIAKPTIPYIHEIQKLKVIVEKLSDPSKLTLLEFTRLKKVYGNMISGIVSNGLPSVDSFKYPRVPDLPAIPKLPRPNIPSVDSFKYPRVPDLPAIPKLPRPNIPST